MYMMVYYIRIYVILYIYTIFYILSFIVLLFTFLLDLYYIIIYYIFLYFIVLYHIVLFYIYMVIDLKVLVRSFNCESRACYVGNPRESFFRIRESKILFRESFAKVGYYNHYM